MPASAFPSSTWFCALLLGLACGLAGAEDAPPSEEQLRKAKLYADVVLRLQGTDLSTDAKTKGLVEKALKANAGLPAFVEIVTAFDLRDRDAELLAMAIAHPDDATGSAALRAVLAKGDLAVVAKVLTTPDGPALARALGNAGDQKAVGLLSPIVIDKKRDLQLRQDSVRALGKFEAGAQALLALVASGQLKDLKVLAGGVLANAPWDALHAEVAKVFPPPLSKDNQTLPSNAELAKRTGDVASGERVVGVVCATCHSIDGKGIDYGPALSEIGSKLGKDALYEAILYPSNGIEHSYSTTLLTLKDGNSAIGIVVSDTPEEVALKAIGGIVSKYKTEAIASRAVQKTSSMPSGLQAQMTQQELVDVVEYLATLKKK